MKPIPKMVLPVPAKRNATQQQQVTFSAVAPRRAQRVLIYGPGGIGKTSLAAKAPGPVAFFDLDDSLGVLNLNVQQVGVHGWEDLLDALRSPGWDEIKTIVIDSVTAAEDYCLRFVLQTVKNDKGYICNRIEDYGYGKGYSYIYEEFLKLFAALEMHVNAGRNVILVAHDTTAEVPNPGGEDWIRYEPRLQSPASGKNSIRLRAREWVDQMFCIMYDVLAQDGKARGTGTRTIYTTERPHLMAKSRGLNVDEILLVQDSTEIWDCLFEGDKHAE